MSAEGNPTPQDAVVSERLARVFSIHDGHEIQPGDTQPESAEPLQLDQAAQPGQVQTPVSEHLRLLAEDARSKVESYFAEETPPYEVPSEPSEEPPVALAA